MGVPPGDAVIVLAFAAAAVVMAVMGLLPGDKGIVLAFAATAAVAAATFIGREVGVPVIVGVAWRELGLDKLCKY